MRSTKCCQQNVINENYRTSLVLWGPYVLYQNCQNQPCAARFKDLMSYKTALCCGSLVLQRRKDLLSFSHGPTFTVLVMLRIESASAFSTTKEQHNSLAKECITRQIKNAAQELLKAQSRGNVTEGNTRAKTCNHSENITGFLLQFSIKYLAVTTACYTIF